MGRFDETYSEEQREAFSRAYVPYKVSAKRVAELAASGQLKRPDGSLLEPFEVKPDTVRSYANRATAKRLGKVDSALADLDHRDAIEVLRRRLVNAASHDLDTYEKKQKDDPNGTEPERLRQIIRCVREAAALPGIKDPRPTVPGSKQGGDRNGAETKGGLAGAILHAARNGTAQDHPHPVREEGQGTADPSHGYDTQDDALAETHDLPGSRASDQAELSHAAS